MILFFTFYTESEELIKIGVNPPLDVDIDSEIVYKYYWDEKEDIPLTPTGDVYTGIIIKSNYNEDGIVRYRDSNEIKIYVDSHLISLPNDYERYELYYKDGDIINKTKLDLCK